MKDYIFTQNRDVLSSLISQNQEIGIIVGENHTQDTVGAALSLFLSLQAFGKKVQIVSAKQVLVEVSHLVGIDKIKQQFDGVINMLTVAIPRRGRAIQKVSYNIEGDYVHLNIVAGEEGLNFSEDEVKYIKKGSTPSLVFAIGVPTLGGIEKFVSVDGGSRIVNVDNSPASQMYGDIVLADTSFSSISEIVTRLILELALPVDIDIAQNLLDGVVEATNNFVSPNSDAYAFEAASFLMKHGAIRKNINNGAPTTTSSSTLRSQAVYDSAGPRVNPFQPVTPVRSPQAKSPFDTKSFADNSNDAISYPDAAPSSIPNDWFTPKVFKGTQKPGQ